MRTPSMPSTPRRTAEPVPQLHSGDRLTQREFHRLYELQPEDFKAELIGGIVYVASPERWRHSRRNVNLIKLLGRYEDATPGVEVLSDATTILGEESEPQPDGSLRLLPEAGGRTRIDAKGYLTGPPELVTEVAHSTVAIDLRDKKADYAKTGVREYVVACLEQEALCCFDLAAECDIALGPDGVFRSRVFPGLWIDSAALFAGNSAQLKRTLERGLKSPEHAAFVRRIKKKLKENKGL